jgi:hypothetical protein
MDTLPLTCAQLQRSSSPTSSPDSRSCPSRSEPSSPCRHRRLHHSALPIIPDRFAKLLAYPPLSSRFFPQSYRRSTKLQSCSSHPQLLRRQTSSVRLGRQRQDRLRYRDAYCRGPPKSAQKDGCRTWRKENGVLHFASRVSLESSSLFLLGCCEALR